jgi:hypothetical protein
MTSSPDLTQAATRHTSRRRRHARIWAGAALLIAIPVAGCSGYNNARGKGDAPVGTSDDSPAQILNMPDGFGNVAMKCDGHGHRVFVPTHAKTDPPVTVVDDASCPGGASR